MPPKQKQAKKGPVYKPAIAAKDIVPPQLKEPPREPKPLKLPETFPEPQKNNEALPAIFEEWPAEETVRAHDFGNNADVRFSDNFHEQIAEYIKKEGEAEWRAFRQVEAEQESGESQGEEELEFNQSKNEIESFKHISTQKIEEKPHGAAPCVIETFLRQENQEEKEARLKEEAEKAEKAAKEKKKAAKKQQPKQQGPVMVSDVKMSDVITRPHMPVSAIWIGSQLQLIKQRGLTDANTGQAIWRKIYPQENGVPQLTKSGKYWVKLLYMGRYVKIEVDDRVPIDQDGRLLFPRSAHANQRWTMILAKALIKYLAKVGSEAVVGSGLVAYALTGMVSENIALGHFKQWQKLQEMLNNHHYQRKDLVVSCFSNDPANNFRKMTQVKVQRQSMQGQYQQQFQEKEIETRIMNGYAYCVGDYFDSEGFNMVFSQQKSQKEMLLKHEYNELCKVSISNKSREEKLEYRRKKKELKEKLGVEERKRLELIAKPAVRHHFLKLLASLRVSCQYGEKEILLAKKCVLNKLNQPPNYDIPLQREEKDSKSIQSLSVSVIKYKEQNELFPNLHDFSAIPGVLDLLQRPDPGKWISQEDFLQFFQAVQVLYNPNAFSHKRIETIESKKAGSFTHQQGKEILVVEKVEQQQEKKVRLLFGLACQKTARDIFSPYSILQKFDFSSFRATSNVMTLSSELSSRVIELPNQNSVFKLYTMSRGNYNYWLSCDSPFKLMSISDYLTEFQGYSKKSLTFEYPPVEAKTYFPIARMRLKQENGGNTVLIKPIGLKEELLGCLNYRFVRIPKEGPMSQQEVEGVVTRKGEEILLAYEYSRFQVEQGEYFLIVQAQAEENIADGTLQLQILTQEQGLTIESAEQVEPVKFIEKYLPNKYGTLCKERIFTNSDNNATLTVRLAEFQEQQAAGGGKGAKKGGKEEATTELMERAFNGQRRIILKILSGESVLYEAVGFNEITVPNFKFLSTKGTGREYSLLVEFDLRTWPEAVLKNEHTEKICWVAQVSAQDSLALIRDTKQEDKEKQTRKSWEDAEPGRAERAKKTRRRFLIELKKERGEALTQEEEQILAAPKLTKKQLLQEQRKAQENKKGKGGKKEEKKTGKDVKKEEVAEEKPVERDPPKSKDNFMVEVKEYLRILQNCVVKYEPLEQGEPRIRSQQELKAIKEGTRLSSQDRVGKLIKNVERRETMKLREKEKREAVAIFATQARSQFKEKYSTYVEWRTQDAEKDKARQDKERLLVDIISQQKPTISQNELKKHINEYKQISGHNPYLADVADMSRKNIRIAALSDRIAALIPTWEIEQLKTIAEEIKNDGIDGIQPELHRQFRELLQQAERNPGIVAQKQAEAKKAKKGGKK